MQITKVLLVSLLVVALVATSADACGRRRRRRRRGGRRSVRWIRPVTGGLTPGPPPIIARPPPPNPTPNPTRQPTPNPTPQPTPEPTPPPPPPPFFLTVPGAPTPVTEDVRRPNCVKSMKYDRRDRGDGSGKKEFVEYWEYKCQYNVYTEIDLPTFKNPQTCACGAVVTSSDPTDPTKGAGAAKRAVQAASPRSTDIQISKVYFVGYNVEKNEPACIIQNFNTMTESKNLSDVLAADAAKPVGEAAGWTQHAQAFAGQVSFTETPPCLDTSLPGMQANIPAMCYEVVATYKTSFKWPENPTPIMSDHPNLWESNCYPCDPEKPDDSVNAETSAAKKRQNAQSQSNIYCKMWYVFNKNRGNVGGGDIHSREITARYINNQCEDRAAYFSVDASFKYTLTRHAHALGAFNLNMEFVRRELVFGAPISWSSNAEYFSKSYYTATWGQPWVLNEDGSFKGASFAYKALLGQEIANSGIPAHVYKVCDTTKGDVVPAAWESSCESLGGVGAGCPTKPNAANYYNEDVIHFPMDGLNCVAIRSMATCSAEQTVIGFMTPGRSSRMFSKVNSETRMFRGPLIAKCQQLVLNSHAATWSPVVFKVPDSQKMGMKKRGVAQTAASSELSVERDDNGYVKSVFHAPVAEFQPVAPTVIVQPAVGSADATQAAPSGDHPIALFPETYAIAVSTDPADKSCGSATGASFDDGGCEAYVMEGTPPCLDGSQGCTCRNPEWGRPLCDAPLGCSDKENPLQGFCVVEGCPVGTSGCECDASGACGDALQCVSGHCVSMQTQCTMGEAGCYCQADGSCATGTECDSGRCMPINPSVCTPGSGGCPCPANQACTAPFSCDADTSMCLASVCSAGDRGCPCNDGLCGYGFECQAKGSAAGVCVTPTCDAGTPGCPCAAGDSCNDADHKCLPVSVDSNEKLCLARIECTSQTARCLAVCGEGNVNFCPACAHQTVLCQEEDDESSSSSLAVAVTAVFFAIVAMFL